MAGNGRISVLVSNELSTLLQAVRAIPKEVASNIRKYTKTEAQDLWQESVRGRVSDRMQTRVLSDTARVAVSDANVMLRSGGIGKTQGTPNSLLAFGNEFGADRNSTKTLTSKRGKSYTRHTRRQFKLPRRGGYIVYPAAHDAIPRVASLWVQTAIRTIHEQFEKGGAR